MPEVDPAKYGKQPRPDDKPGFAVVTPTTMRYYEADGTDVRLDRTRIFDENGKLVASFLMDKMGLLFTDNLPETEDDPEYLEKFERRFNL